MWAQEQSWIVLRRRAVVGQNYCEWKVNETVFALKNTISTVRRWQYRDLGMFPSCSTGNISCWEYFEGKLLASVQKFDLAAEICHCFLRGLRPERYKAKILKKKWFTDCHAQLRIGNSRSVTGFESNRTCVTKSQIEHYCEKAEGYFGTERNLQESLGKHVKVWLNYSGNMLRFG